MPGFDLTQLTSSLGAYHRKHSDELFSTLLERDHELRIFQTISGVKDEFVFDEVQMTEVIQAYQKTWTPKGDIIFKPEILKARRIKVDMELDIIALERTWEGARIDGSLPEGQEFFEGYIMDYIAKRIRKDLRTALFKGIYVAPTTGTAGAAINSMDGLLTQYTTALAASKINNVVATGVLTPSNVREKLEDIYDSVDDDFKEENLVMLVSGTVLRWYKRDYRSEFGANTDYNAPGKELVPAIIDGTNTEVIGIPAMNGSSAVIVTTKDNLKRLIDGTGEDSDFNLRFQVNRRIIDVLADFKMGVGFPIIKGLVWGNDPTPLV